MSVRDLKVSEAAALLGVSTDTMRRRAEAAGVEASTTAGVTTYPAAAVARLAVAEAELAARRDQLGELAPASARNRLRGIVTRVVRDGVMAQVDVQAGPYRLVSLISREAADELGLAEGSVVAAIVKATNVGIEGVTR